jgi:hypothetical protein
MQGGPSCNSPSAVQFAGKPSAEQLAHIRTRKPAPPVMEVTLADGSKVPLWNTFKDQQVRQSCAGSRW